MRERALISSEYDRTVGNEGTRKRSSKRFPGFASSLFFLLLLLGTGCPTDAFAMKFYGLWEGSVGGGEDVETVKSFHQQYRVSQGFFLDLTDAVNGSVGVNYTYDDRSNTGYYDILNPTLDLSVNNDIFRVGYAGTATISHRRFDQNYNNLSWQTNLYPGSLFVKPYWPTLRLYYGESQAEQTSRGLTRYDRFNSDYGADVNWSLPGVNLFYGYNTVETRNRLSGSEERDVSHFGSLYSEGYFFEERLSYKLKQSVDYTTDEFIGAVPQSGVIEQVLNLPTLAVLDPEGGDPDCELHDITLNLESGLRDQDSVTVSVAPDQSWHLGVSEIFGGIDQVVARIRIYIDDPFGDVITDQTALLWKIYAGFDNLGWDPVSCDATPVYNSIEQRYEIDIPELTQPYQYLKVVVSNQSDRGLEGFTLPIRAVEAVSLITGTPGTALTIKNSATNYRTDLNVFMKISPTMRASTQLLLFYGDTYSNETLHGYLNWRPTPYIAPSLNFNINLVETEGSEDPEDPEASRVSSDSENYTYGINIPISILPTLSVILGGTWTERYRDSRRISERDSYLFNIAAILYPNLTASLNTTYNTGSNVSGENVVESENLNSSLLFSAQLTPRLTFDLENNYIKTYAPSPSTLGNSNIKLDYRPSDYLWMFVEYITFWLGDISDSIDFTTNLALLRTYKTRLTFNYNIRQIQGEDPSQAFSLLASWDISKILTLKSQAGYFLEDQNSWSFQASLYMHF